MPRVRHHVNPLNAAYLTLGVGPAPLPAAGEVEVELGCADALFLFDPNGVKIELNFAAAEARGRRAGVVAAEFR